MGLRDYISHRLDQQQKVSQVCESTSDSEEESDETSLTADTGPKMSSLEIERGDTLSTVIRRAFIKASQTHAAIEALRKVFNPRDLRTNHQIYITYNEIDGDDNNRDLLKLRIRLSLDQEVIVEQTEEGRFQAELIQKQLVKEVRRVAGKIESSLYLECSKKGVHPQVLSQMLNAYAYDVDFQRSFQSGDDYCLLFEYYKDPETLEERPGNLLFASLVLRGQEIKIYRFKPATGEYQYFNEKGESVRKGLLTTPIDGARISSNYGSRKHPVLGYTKMHKGVDFAAVKGTPIKAAGDGRIVKIGSWGSYGNYIQVRHNNKFSTAYAHMCRFAKGLKVGSTVRQGQVIGYVGRTGRATGCHLHYELLENGRQVNPKHIKSLPAGKLNKKDLGQFLLQVKNIDVQNQNLLNQHLETLQVSEDTETTSNETEPNATDKEILSPANSQQVIAQNTP